MKKYPMISRIYLVLILSIFATAAVADDCCNYECDDPLYCGSWWLQADAGVYPTIWNDRGHVFLNACDGFGTCSGTTTSTDLGELPKFNKFFKLPWIIGGQLAYSWSGHCALYGELNYIQAGHKNTAVNTVTAVNSALAIRLGHYQAVSGYVGARYYTCRWCDSAAFFVGAKIGFIYRSNFLSHALTVPTAPATGLCVCSSPLKRDFFTHAAKVSGGVNIGLDYLWCDCWSVVLTGEVVVSSGPRGNNCIPLIDTERFQLVDGSALAVKHIKTEISFPVTLGLKYNF